MDLTAYVEQKFNEDGDATSFFIEDFKIAYYNHDFQEALFCESENNSRGSLLQPLSYSTSIIGQVKDRNWKAFNTVIAIFDFSFENEIKSNGSKNVIYLGEFNYNKNVG